MCRRHWNWHFSVVCWIGISSQMNPRISFSCSKYYHNSAPRPVTLSLADGSNGQQIPIGKQSQICSNLWILFYLQFVEEVSKWLAGPPITSGSMPRQAQPWSHWQVWYYVWWVGGWKFHIYHDFITLLFSLFFTLSSCHRHPGWKKTSTVASNRKQNWK